MSLVLKSNASYVGNLNDLPVIPDMYRITSAVTMVGTRLLSSNYKGALLRVVRTSDGLEKDIFSKADGSLDTASLMSFVGSSTGRVAVMYDQSERGNDMQHVSADGLPTIVLDGVLQKNDKGEPCILFNATGKALFLKEPPSGIQKFMGAYIEGSFSGEGFAALNPVNETITFFSLVADIAGIPKLNYRNNSADTLKTIVYDTSMSSGSQKYFASIDSVAGKATAKDGVSLKTQSLVGYEPWGYSEIILGSTAKSGFSDNLRGRITAFVFVNNAADLEELKNTI